MYTRSSPFNHRIRQIQGFSLVELLVVISIIALLIAILLPSLRKAREQAKRVVCLSSLRAIATSSLIYASEDPTEAAIPIHPIEFTDDGFFVGAYEFGGKSGIGEPFDKTSPLDSRWGTRHGRGPSTRPLNPYIYKDGFIDNREGTEEELRYDTTLELDMFTCPGDRGYQGIHYRARKNSRLTSYDHFGTSYAANVFWIGVSEGPCVMRSNSPYLRPLSRISNPANTIYYEENVGRFAWMREPDPCPIPDIDGVPGRVKGWHGKMWEFNVAFADGHCAWINMDGYRPTRLSDYPMHITGAAGSFESWQCVIIRGEHWQRDTLPSPDVYTTRPCPAAGRPSEEGGSQS